MISFKVLVLLKYGFLCTEYRMMYSVLNSMEIWYGYVRHTADSMEAIEFIAILLY